MAVTGASDGIIKIFNQLIVSAQSLGVQAFAMVIILLIFFFAIAKNSRLGIALSCFAMLLVVSLFVISLISPPPPPHWKDYGFNANWGGEDRYYGSGDVPTLSRLCDGSHIGFVATCWSSRSSAGSLAPGVATDITTDRNDWCAYKGNNIHLDSPRDNSVTPGRVFVCEQGQ
jgi:hypothetical protein